MAKPVMAIAEQRNGIFRKATYEVVSEGRRLADQLGTELVAVLLGSGIEGLSQQLAHYGANKVLMGDNEIFKNYSSEGYTKTILEAVKKVDPEIILLPASTFGKDLGPRLAAHLGVGLATDCVKLRLENGKLRAIRPMYAGKVLAEHELLAKPQIVSLRPNNFPALSPDASKTATIEPLNVPISAGDLRAVVKEFVSGEGGKVELTEANIIVSGGRGMKGPENFKILEELAAVLGAAVGASRSAVDAGWRPHSDQVGQTGKTVSPNLYIACGISGAIQHLAGMSSSKCIVAINKDPEAPIFQRADYGIVGDLFEVVPRLTEEFKKIIEK
ncbi:MAG: electron transfer flavoprotein subunit alpha/FixB family protein [candidate division KSB1 bacterium]|nr:electron transfer flavoprotein subunit alpha/FixB family protein [candidate division KSB1 bacterium]MDZ7336288.1 electron transfer flavoprotein subunit alpha/FixB family protein [candidate division KSB1 bacterium]MDZ7358101.1 electron transfer flavoprotein subunit alpha/FixB family protein [candidate division KSB1 bacterium]MDZ7375439.1 electron transfer flavoprotein subunit alpha/FixB family protein [candidate division KSB1 bacterium]MDZ7399500.1 electron transfer flavoprotein subunit alpha